MLSAMGQEECSPFGGLPYRVMGSSATPPEPQSSPRERILSTSCQNWNGRRQSHHKQSKSHPSRTYAGVVVQPLHSQDWLFGMGGRTLVQVECCSFTLTSLS